MSKGKKTGVLDSVSFGDGVVGVLKYGGQSGNSFVEKEDATLA
jgi:hypothetical protein